VLVLEFVMQKQTDWNRWCCTCQYCRHLSG